MESPYGTMRRLHERGPEARGLVIDREGVMLGPDRVLVRRSPDGGAHRMKKRLAPELGHVGA